MIKENIKTYKKEWREKNKDKQIIYTNRWKTKNPEKYKIKNRKYTKEFNLKNPLRRREHLAKYYKKSFIVFFVINFILLEIKKDISHLKYITKILSYLIKILLKKFTNNILLYV